jgi:phosphate transport system substrate-binding protein
LQFFDKKMIPLLTRKTLLPIAFLLASSASGAAGISGAGSSAAASLYASWAGELTHKNALTLSYAANGSAAGIKAIRDGRVDFGASDVALLPADLERSGLIDFPTAISGIVPALNLPGIQRGELKLSGAILADLLSGRIERWNAAPIAALNKNVKLPDLPVQIVAREDGSGTTYVLSYYLSQVSPAWAQKIGRDFKLKWPQTARLVKGTGAVIEAVARTPGAIGYAEYGAVEKAQLDYARIGNTHGEYPRPGAESFRAALNGSEWTSAGHFEQMLTNLPGKGAWPITSGTFVVMRKTASDSARITQALSLFSYGFMKGDGTAAQNGWIPLPQQTQARVVREMGKIRDRNNQALAWNMNY